MFKLNKNMKAIFKTLTLTLLVLNSFVLFVLEGVEAKDKGDDIILTKGKLIMRGGKGKGNLILDTGSKSSDHHEMIPMMPMSHHFNPYSFYPMQHHQPQPIVIHPVYMEDHSAMHHHQPQQHHEYHHEEPHYQHHEMHQYNHHTPLHHEAHHEMHHEPMHHDMHHEMHHEPMHHDMHHYEPEGQHEEEGHHGGYETHPMMSMMMHGSGLQPTYQQLAAMQAVQHPSNYALHLQAQSFPGQQVDIRQHQQSQQEQQQQEQQHQQQPQQQAMASEPENKKSSLLGQASNSPLAAIIKPLFKRDPAKQKKP